MGRDRKTDVLRVVQPTGNDLIIGIDAENPEGEFVRFRLNDLFSDPVADISDMEVRRGDGEDYRPLREWLALGGGEGAPVAVAWADIVSKPATFPPSAHSHAWAEIADKPTLFSGSYADLTGTPAIPASLDDLADVSLTGAAEGYVLKLIGGVWVPAPDDAGSGSGSTAWADITGKPAFAAVATSGSYTDLSGKPALFDGTWSSLSGKPTTFPPTAHTHGTSGIDDDAITNAKLANMAVSTIKGRVTAGTGDPEDLTATQVKAIIGDASETATGVIEIATQAETNTGTDDVRAVTPKKLRWGVETSLGQTGYIAFPTWLGGFIIQWSTFQLTVANTFGTWTYPKAFPNSGAATIVLINPISGSASAGISTWHNSPSGTSVQVAASAASFVQTVAIGW